MGTIIIISLVYTAAQIIYYIRKRYIKEIFISLVIISISVIYLIDFVKDLKIPSIADMLDFVFSPVAKLIFEIKG